MMNSKMYFLLLIMSLGIIACKPGQQREAKSDKSVDFPKELVDFVPYSGNPVFSGTNSETWDHNIRERGFILAEDGIFKMWYTGYVGGENDQKSLGYATSADGILWERHAKNPVFNQKWTEDVFVLKENGIYYMYAEGVNDIAHLLSSPDGITWNEIGILNIRTTKGDTIQGPYGTPTVLIDKGKWYLFYERNDEAIWLASSTDRINWTNVTDEPVLKPGPNQYDYGAVATNQVIWYKNKYYMFYHGTSNTDWSNPNAVSEWTSNIAMSTDLIHWIKYPQNPIVEGDHSSPIVVLEGDKFRLFTMHDKVCLYNPR